MNAAAAIFIFVGIYLISLEPSALSAIGGLMLGSVIGKRIFK